jgi:hypothetical protein
VFVASLDSTFCRSLDDLDEMGGPWVLLPSMSIDADAVSLTEEVGGDCVSDGRDERCEDCFSDRGVDCI